MVLIETEVVDAIIEVDGQIIGSTPFDGLIPAGTHTPECMPQVTWTPSGKFAFKQKYVLDFDLTMEPPLSLPSRQSYRKQVQSYTRPGGFDLRELLWRERLLVLQWELNLQRRRMRLSTTSLHFPL